MEKTAYCHAGQHVVPRDHIAATRKDPQSGRSFSICFTCLNGSVKGQLTNRVITGAQLLQREQAEAQERGRRSLKHYQNNPY